MSYIYSTSDLRKWDAYTIKHTPIKAIDLMERAALICTKKMLGTYRFETVDIVCGLGNNGGDGLAIARLLANCGIKVTVHICKYTAEQSEAFAINLKRLPASVTLIHLSASKTGIFNADLIVDCIFGTGLNREISGWLAQTILAINNSKKTILSIDMPSGLFATDNTQNSLKTIIRANRTFSFQVPKMPFLFAEYENFVGKFSLLDIQLSTAFKGRPLATYLTKNQLNLNRKSTFAHKGKNGFLTVIAGSEQMLGAGLICAEAGLRSGAGYVGVISPKSIITPLATRLPEALFIGQKFEEIPSKTTAIAIGPGLGKSKESFQLLELALNAQFPMVIDADALNLLAEHPTLLKQLPKNSILTPHLGELNRLIGKCKRPEQLLEKQKELSKKHCIYIVQKGAYSKITTPNGELIINSSGNPYMATAGMGDALTGIIGGLLAQGYTPQEATKIGVFIHGLAGDMALKKNGTYGLITSDILKTIGQALNSI